jgi:hypothetical protein
MRFSLVVIGFGLLGSFCNPGPEAPPRPPPPNVDGGGTSDDCPTACARLIELCQLPNNSEPDCMAACVNAESSGIITFCPAFVSRATTCEEARRFSQCDEAP